MGSNEINGIKRDLLPFLEGISPFVFEVSGVRTPFARVLGCSEP